MHPSPLFIPGLALALAGTTFLSAQEPSPRQPAPPPRPTGPVLVTGLAAKVNGHAVTIHEVFGAIAPQMKELVRQFPNGGPEFEREFRKARDAALQELIDRAIILEEYKQIQKEKGAIIKDHVVDEAINREIRSVYAGDEAKFQEELKRSRTTMDGYRRRTKDKIIIQAMRQQQFADSPPPLPYEIRAEYELMKKEPEYRDTTKDSVTFRKIYILKNDPEWQLPKVVGLVQQLRAGKDFDELAMEETGEVVDIRENVPRRKLGGEFADALFVAKPGQVLDVLQNPAGYAIIQLIKFTLDTGSAGIPADPAEDKVSFKMLQIPRKPPPPPEKQRELAETLMKQIKTGKDFAALAKAYSRDAFRDEGGLQSNVLCSDLQPQLAAMLFSGKEGELLPQPLEDPNGYSIIMPVKISPGPPRALEGELLEAAKARAQRKKTSAQYERWIESRRKKALIDIKPKWREELVSRLFGQPLPALCE